MPCPYRLIGFCAYRGVSPSQTSSLHVFARGLTGPANSRPELGEDKPACSRSSAVRSFEVPSRGYCGPTLPSYATLNGPCRCVAGFFHIAFCDADIPLGWVTPVRIRGVSLFPLDLAFFSYQDPVPESYFNAGPRLTGSSSISTAKCRVCELFHRLEHDFGPSHVLGDARPVRTGRTHGVLEFFPFVVSDWAIIQQMFGGLVS